MFGTIFRFSYATLRPEQKRLVDDFVRRYNQTTGSKITSEQAYDGARISVRTTFDAVTHALLTTELTNENGQSLGRAIDLVEAVDEVRGQEPGTRGDLQFRLFVYLKPKAFDNLFESREFLRDKNNTIYHKGFPICFRLKQGPPSIHFSISRDERMSDIDVDYRSSKFPKALFNGHLTAANSDVRAGNNLETHDKRWAGFIGWWHEVFGFFLSSSAELREEAASGRARTIPLNPRVKANQGIDASAHDFLKSWVVEKQPNNAVAYLSRRSYPCLEEMAQSRQESLAIIRFRTITAMENFNATIGNVTSVADVFEAAGDWAPGLREAKNTYPAEFKLVSVPSDMARDEECAQAPEERGGKQAKEGFFAAAFRGRQGDGRNKVTMLLWVQEGSYWKIAAIRNEDSSGAGFTPKRAVVAPPGAKVEPEKIAGDPDAVKDITAFYQFWIGKRDTAGAMRYVSERLYQCLGAPSEEEKKMTPAERIRRGLEMPLPRIPQRPNLSDMMSDVPPVDELVRPVEQENAKAFAMMAVPDQMADSFLCEQRELPERTPMLKANDAKYGNFYLTDTRLNVGEEESPAFLLLWTKEKDRWKIIAWTVEVP